MADILTWGLGQISSFAMLSSGGSVLIISLICLTVTSILLWMAKASLPVAGLIVFLELGVLSLTLNAPGDPLLGGALDGGAINMLYLLVVAMTGFLIYHFLFKRTNMG